MTELRFVFVIVVYRNTSDIEELLLSIKSHKINAEVVIVNNYYDNDSLLRCSEIASKYEGHFINIENKGYGYGNNRGIEYSNKNLKYDYLIISNPDVIIKQFDTTYLSNQKDYVIGPLIKTISGKNQNPYWFVDNPIAEWFIFKGYKYKSRLILYSGIAINKFIREAFLLIFKLRKKRYTNVFALHGSFVIFSKNVLTKIGLPYDEDMFLFAEEAHLAHLLKRNNMKSVLTKDIEVLHKEDGSMSLANLNLSSELKKSVITYYTKLRKKNI
ncbi:glycosyltransferase family 2 protein [Rossellomorea vietnamensis]|uniref:glycosyltransferase family 2 protein n=1 Tax=Rossellomorea vietnamensis TaxID=218284 RepID=UPI00077CC51A|nr:glycosyltransferase family 2 protein [Rossellomorea vietnamensis]